MSKSLHAPAVLPPTAKLLRVAIPLTADATPVGPEGAALFAQTQTTGLTLPFLLSGVSRGHPTLPANTYTGKPSQRLDRYWKVTMAFAKIPDRSVDFYFDQEADAREFAKMGLQTMPSLFQNLDPVNAKFVSQGVGKAKRFVEPNRYTGRASSAEQWHALLWCDWYGRYADVWFGNAAEAAQFGTGTAVTLPELLLPQTTGVPIPYFQHALAGQFGGLPVPQGYLGPLVVFQVFAVFYPTALYTAEIYFTGGWVDTNFHGPGLFAGGQRNAGYNFGSGVYYDATLGNWQPLPLTLPAGTAPPGPVGLGTGGYVQVGAVRQLVNGVANWVIVYLFSGE